MLTVDIEDWQRVLRQALNKDTDTIRKKSARFRRFVHRILDFDGYSTKSSIAGLNYFYWRDALWSGFSRDELGMLAGAVWEDNELTSDLIQGLLGAVDKAIETMVERYGTTELRYGDVFRLGRGGYSWPVASGLIAPADRSVCGQYPQYPLLCNLTLHPFFFGPPDEQGQRWAVSGSRILILVIFTDPIQSFTIHHFGQSEHEDSPHYADQARLTSERRLKPIYFHEQELMKHVLTTKTLEVRVD